MTISLRKLSKRLPACKAWRKLRKRPWCVTWWAVARGLPSGVHSRTSMIEKTRPVRLTSETKAPALVALMGRRVAPVRPSGKPASPPRARPRLPEGPPGSGPSPAPPFVVYDKLIQLAGDVRGGGGDAAVHKVADRPFGALPVGWRDQRQGRTILDAEAVPREGIGVIDEGRALRIQCERGKRDPVLPDVRAEEHEGRDHMVQPVLGRSSLAVVNAFIAKDASTQTSPAKSLECAPHVASLVPGYRVGQVVAGVDAILSSVVMRPRRECARAAA